MSKTLTLTDEQIKALEALGITLVAEPDAPAREAERPCAQTRKDGEACKGKALPGREVCVAHSKTQPKAEPKAPKKGRKAKAAKTVEVYVTNGKHADGSRKITMASRNALREAGVTGLGKRSSKVAAQRAKACGVEAVFVHLHTGERL